MVDIQVEVEVGEDVEHPAVNDHQLIVIAQQIVRGPRNRDAHFEQTHFIRARVSCASERGQ